MPVNDELEKGMEETKDDEMIAVAFINGDTGQPFDTEEDFFNAVRNLVAKDKFNKETNRISEKYKLSKELVRCHILNWESPVICHAYNNECSLVAKCRKLYENLKVETK